AAGSATHAVAVGNGVDALVIDNGVVTVVPIGGSGFGDVAFASPSVVVALGATDMRSTDGGMTWSPTNGPFNNVTALAFTTPTRAFGVTPTGIVRSDDTGDTWTAVPSGAVTGLRGIAFADANHGMAVGRHVLMTNDGGMTWTPLDQPTDLILNHVSMIAQNLAFVSGLHENVLRYGNSPVPTLIQALDVTPRPFGAELRWRVSIDDQLAGFTIMRSSGAASERIASNIAVSERSFRDDGLTPGATYEYQLLAVDRDGSYTQSAPVKVTIPSASVELLPNQPNPFNPETTIRFMLPEKMPVVLTVHDVAGHVVATLVNGVSAAGMQTITWNADHMASGVYFAKLRAGKTEISRKMVLLK
ncbi:MAG TPA: T9SS type A sorting domain-containing protein, partial [Candidatus Krumholzibacteria bacterium]|nr:T9SS type A sorting domain-containing protein [Candidatus Krumholzibacteria bacterium]